MMNTHTLLKAFFALGLYLGIVGSSVANIQMTKDGIKFPDNTEQTTAVPTPVGGNVDQILKSGGSTGKFVWTEMSGGGAPMGMIAMWSGTISNIPTGWVICDGNNGTPNLTDKFIKASSTAGSTGGSNTHTHGHTLQGGAHTLTVAQMPSHTHTSKFYAGGANTGNKIAIGHPNDYRSTGDSVEASGGGGSHSHPVSGSINSGSNQPEYYSLLFIMKVAPNATSDEPLGTAIVSGTEPTTASLGAQWYDTNLNQLKAKINTGWVAIGGQSAGWKLFTEAGLSGTFVVPAGVNKIFVSGAGGAGGAGFRLNYDEVDPGCRGTEYSRFPLPVIPGQAINYYIGHGGEAIVNIVRNTRRHGNHGEDTTFSYLVLKGGHYGYDNRDDCGGSEWKKLLFNPAEKEADHTLDILMFKSSSSPRVSGYPIYKGCSYYWMDLCKQNIPGYLKIEWATPN
jgi:hypothetical protein